MSESQHVRAPIVMQKPAMLRPGDTIAAVTLSWGGPGTFPHRYQAGKRQLEAAYGLRVVETPHALRDPGWIYAHPASRAADLMQAFADPTIRGIVSTIGGEESIRLLPYLDLDIIRANPKIFMGYSDTAVTHLACFSAGLVSFYGPSVMAGFAENGGIFPYTDDSLRRTLFSANPPGVIAPNQGGWTAEMLDWGDPANQERRRKLRPSSGWRWLQGRAVAQGPLIGGCLEVLDWLRGTAVWPGPEAWRGAILFIETSEEQPPPEAVSRILRTFAAAGVFDDLAGLIVGRPGASLGSAAFNALSEADLDRSFAAYDAAILSVVAGELGLTDLPIVTGVDFGHTDPMFVLPYGVQAQLDCERQEFAIVEGAVVAG